MTCLPLSCTWDTGDVDSQRFGWLSSLEDELLYRRLCKLPEDDLELLTLHIEGTSPLAPRCSLTTEYTA